MVKPYQNFDYQSYHWRPEVDYRTHPELYKVGKGEQGVLICEPYKSELVPLWRFKTPEIAEESACRVYQKFLDYLASGEFVIADMARKFLQMGFTRARRYTNYKGGRKYHKETDALLEKGMGDPQKARSAEIFYDKWQLAKAHPDYQLQKSAWKQRYG